MMPDTTTDIPPHKLVSLPNFCKRQRLFIEGGLTDVILAFFFFFNGVLDKSQKDNYTISLCKVVNNKLTSISMIIYFHFNPQLN